MNLLPWRLIKLSVIFPLRNINLAAGEGRGGVGGGGGWTQTRTFGLPLAVSVSPSGDGDLDCGLACLAGWDGRDRKASGSGACTSVWSLQTMRTAGKRQQDEPRASYNPSTRRVLFFSSRQQCDRCFSPPGDDPSARLCRMNSDGNVKITSRANNRLRLCAI